jgi:hypothetical protein
MCIVYHACISSLINADGLQIACKAGVRGVLGVKDSMIAHLLGRCGHGPCQNASSEAQKVVKALRKGKGKRDQGDSDDDMDEDDRQKL